MFGYLKPHLWDTFNPMNFVMSFAEGDGGAGGEGGEGGAGGAGGEGGAGGSGGEGFSWKSQLPQDIANSPTMQKYADDATGLQGAAKGLLDLNQMLGHEKVPIPKDANDTVAWGRLNKAMGVPETADGYKLADVSMPEVLKEISFDKAGFQEIVHKYNLTPKQAEGLWGEYTQGSLQSYNKAQDDYTNGIEATRSGLMKEWGDAYQGKVDLGQKVINKFSGDQETATWITEAMLKDPRGAKFLAQIGESFAENQIGDFEYKRHSLTPSEAQTELDAIYANPDHPYGNSKALQKDHDEAVAHVNMLLAIAAKSQ